MLQNQSVCLSAVKKKYARAALYLSSLYFTGGVPSGLNWARSAELLESSIYNKDYPSDYFLCISLSRLADTYRKG